MNFRRKFRLSDKGSFLAYLRSIGSSIFDILVHIAQDNWGNVGFELKHDALANQALFALMLQFR